MGTGEQTLCMVQYGLKYNSTLYNIRLPPAAKLCHINIQVINYHIINYHIINYPIYDTHSEVIVITLQCIFTIII